MDTSVGTRAFSKPTEELQGRKREMGEKGEKEGGEEEEEDREKSGERIAKSGPVARDRIRVQKQSGTRETSIQQSR